MAQLRRYLEKCVYLERKECLFAERRLKRTRSEAAGQLAAIQKNLREAAALPAPVDENHAWDVLANRNRAAALDKAAEEVARACARLYEIHETLVDGDVVLNGRIGQLRSKATLTINDYVKGVRAGGMADFRPSIVFSDAATKQYYEKHRRTDEAVAAAAVPAEEEAD